MLGTFHDILSWPVSVYIGEGCTLKDRHAGANKMPNSILANKLIGRTPLAKRYGVTV